MINVGTGKAENVKVKKKMTIMDESGIEIFVLPDCARCELAGCNPCDLNDCPRGLSECVPDSCLYYTEEWNNYALQV
jgi:hypothetical protein